MEWRKSTASNDSGACVEVAWRGGAETLVRDSKHPTGPRLVVDRVAWTALLARART